MPATDSEEGIKVKEAFAKAVVFAREVLGDLPFSLEEIDRGEYKGTPVWELTLGYPAPIQPKPVGNLGDQWAALVGNRPKVYKRFFVDVHTGEIISMKLRELTAGS